MALTYTKSKWVSALSLSLLCAISVSGCSKKDKDTTTEADTAVDVQTEEAVVNQLPCDDVATINSLTRSIKGVIAQQARTEISKYATQVGTSFDMTAVNGAMNDIIIDFGTPTVLDNANANGMQTCQTSLSLTVPSENIFLANEVYNGLDGKSMQQILASANIRLNNNMLVDDAFTYVVGMQGGQVVAKVAGQPAIIKAVADIMAKSQLKAMVETSNTSHMVHPIAPVTPRPPAEPRIPDNTVDQGNSASTADSRSNNRRDGSQAENSRTPSNNNARNESSSRNTSNKNQDAILSVPKTDELSVPTDDSMEMVIIEENATY